MKSNSESHIVVQREILNAIGGKKVKLESLILPAGKFESQQPFSYNNAKKHNALFAAAKQYTVDYFTSFLRMEIIA